MPRFFFHVDDGMNHVDAEGTELSTLGAAREHAVCYFADLLRDAPGPFWSRPDWTMRVTDQAGLVFFTLHFTAVLAPAGKRGSPSPLN
jgi:hypothetical protein